MSPRAKTSSARLESERGFQAALLEMAMLYGFMAYHTWQSTHSAKGFPDLVFAKDGRVIFAELKSEAGTLTVEQSKWLEVLRSVPGVEVYLWRPADFGVIHAILARE